MATAEASQLTRHAFWTELGWTGIVVSRNGVERVFFDCESEAQAWVLIENWTPPPPRRQPAAKPRRATDRDKLTTRVEQRLIDFAIGERVKMSDLPVSLVDLTPFQCAVTEACRKIPYGKTRSYGELAEQVGSPRAARAVGTVMANNRYPLIVPCHRVVGSQGVLGGFSSRSGVSMKQRLLGLEQ